MLLTSFWSDLILWFRGMWFACESPVTFSALMGKTAQLNRQRFNFANSHAKLCVLFASILLKTNKKILGKSQSFQKKWREFSDENKPHLKEMFVENKTSRVSVSNSPQNYCSRLRPLSRITNTIAVLLLCKFQNTESRRRNVQCPCAAGRANQPPSFTNIISYNFCSECIKLRRSFSHGNQDCLVY